MIYALTFALLAIAPAIDTPATDDAIIDRIVSVGCRGHHPTREMVVELLEIERAAGFPDAVRGLVVAAACNESGFKPRARGDWYSLVSRGQRCRRVYDECAPTSVGMMQLGGWAKRGLRKMGATMPEPRFDWRLSARFWARHVAAQVSRVREVCPTLRRGWDRAGEVDVWRAAHRTAVTYPKCGQYLVRGGRQVCVKRVPRCHRIGKRYQSSHWRILATWRGDAEPTPEKWKGIPRAVRLPVKTALHP